MTAAPPVLIDVSDGVAVLTLNRPERKNAWTVQMQAAYFNALAAAASDPAIRAIVVTGANHAFCPGADTEALTTYTETGTTNPLADEIQQPEWFPSTIEKPIIAAIEGPCAGVGLAQALQCDIRIASPDARFSTAFARRGLPAMHGGEWLLDQVAGSSVARELLLTGRTFTGLEAAALGVVNENSDAPLARALEVALEMAQLCSPASMAHVKRQLLTCRDKSLSDAITEVDAVVDIFLASDDFREGLTSFIERRPPKFAGLATTPTTDSTKRLP